MTKQNKNGIIRFRVEFEESPILDLKTKKLKDMDDIMEDIKKKLG
jgi:hypothetical protein